MCAAVDDGLEVQSWVGLDWNCCFHMGRFCRDYSGLGFLSIFTRLIMFAFGFLGLMNLQMMNLIGEELLELQKIVGLGGNWKYNEALFRKLKFLAVFFFFFFFSGINDRYAPFDLFL